MSRPANGGTAPRLGRVHGTVQATGLGWGTAPRTPSIVPNGHDQTFYIVVNNYGELGLAFTETDLGEADLETTITDLMTGQYNERVRIVSFNTSERWAEDASEGCRAGDYAPP